MRLLENDYFDFITTAVTRHLVVKNTLLYSSEIALTVSKLTIDALSIAGWVMAIGPLLDIIFEYIWDPLKLTVRPLSNDRINELIHTEKKIVIIKTIYK